jgi:hypothetical protein
MRQGNDDFFSDESRVAAACFYLPLLSTHDTMRRAKDAELVRIDSSLCGFAPNYFAHGIYDRQHH